MVRKACSSGLGKGWPHSQIPMEKNHLFPSLMFLAGPGRVLISHPMVPTSRIKQWCSNSPSEMSQGLPPTPVWLKQVESVSFSPEWHLCGWVGTWYSIPCLVDSSVPTSLPGLCQWGTPSAQHQHDWMSKLRFISILLSFTPVGSLTSTQQQWDWTVRCTAELVGSPFLPPMVVRSHVTSVRLNKVWWGY